MHKGKVTIANRCIRCFSLVCIPNSLLKGPFQFLEVRTNPMAFERFVNRRPLPGIGDKKLVYKALGCIVGGGVECKTIGVKSQLSNQSLMQGECGMNQQCVLHAPSFREPHKDSQKVIVPSMIRCFVRSSRLCEPCDHAVPEICERPSSVDRTPGCSIGSSKSNG